MSSRAPLWAAVGVIVLLILFGSFAIVPEDQQAVVVRFDKPVRILNRYRPGTPIGAAGAGLSWRLPYPFEQLIRIDKRVLDLELPPQSVTSVDQRQLLVDSYARYRIVDPLAYVRSGGQTQLAEQLRPLLGSALHDALGKQPSAVLLGGGPELVRGVRASLDRVARPYGVEIVDVELGKATLPAGAPLEAAIDTMRNARQQQARSIRLKGVQDAEAIQDQADSQAAQIYAASFGKDPQFYDFYRAMQSYRTTFIGDEGGKPPAPTTVVLSPSDDYLRQFAGRAPAGK